MDPEPFDKRDYIARLHDRTDDYELHLDGARAVAEIGRLSDATPPRFVVVTDSTATMREFADVIVVDLANLDVVARFIADTDQGTKRERAEWWANRENERSN